MRHFVFVESNTTGTGRQAVERLLQAGERVTFLAREPEKYPFLRMERPGLTVLAEETNDVEAVTARVAAVARRQPVDALLTFSDYYVAIVAEVAARLGFRYLDPEAARTCRDKHATRQAMRRAGLATPEFHLVATPEEAQRLSREVAYPCVVKPLSESSSKGVLRVEDAGQLLAQFRELHGWRENSRRQPMSGQVLVESLLAGPEFSVETFTLASGRTEVLGITTKHLSPPPLFVEMGHDFPSVLESAAAARLTGAVLAALQAVGYDCGPAHTEIRLTPDGGPVVVEINPRLAGGMIPELVRLALGVDLVEALFDHLSDRPVDLRSTRDEWASIRFLTASRHGRLAAVAGLQEARQLATVGEVNVSVGPGAEVRPAEEATHRLGYVIASGPDRQRVLGEVDAALARITLDIEPVVPEMVCP
jgi:cysteine synthase A